MTAAKALALTNGRTSVEVADVVRLAPNVLSHRLVCDDPREVVAAAIRAGEEAAA